MSMSWVKGIKLWHTYAPLNDRQMWSNGDA